MARKNKEPVHHVHYVPCRRDQKCYTSKSRVGADSGIPDLFGYASVI